jgi:hypothetical protein
MCNFLSAILTKTGQFYYDPAVSDHHSHLIKKHGLREGVTAKAAGGFIDSDFVRLELTPGADIADVATWHFKLDEENPPSWWDLETAARAEDDLRKIAYGMILRTHLDKMESGFKIVVAGGSIGLVTGGTIRVWGGTFTTVRGGTFTTVWGGTFTTVWGGTFTTVRGGTFTTVRGGTFTTVWGGTFTTVRGGTFTTVRGGGTIQVYFGKLPAEILERAVVIDRRDGVLKVLTEASIKMAAKAKSAKTKKAGDTK